MDAIMEILSRGTEELYSRADGPLYFRLYVMPTIVTILGIRAGLKDARNGEQPFLWAILTNRTERPRLCRSALKDIGRVIITALVLDTIYQFMVLRAFYIIQALIVAVVCAIVPYVLFRGPVTCLMRLVDRSKTKVINETTVKIPSDVAECNSKGNHVDA